MAVYHEYLYLEMLNNASTIDKKIEAVSELGKLKSHQSSSTLLKIATDMDQPLSLRESAIFALSEIGNSEFIQKFLPLKNLTEDDIIEVILLSIIKQKNELYIDQFLDFVNYPNVEIKKDIIEGLADLDTEKSLKIMIKFSNDKDIETRELVKEHLKNSDRFRTYIETANEDELLNIITMVPEEKAALLMNKLIKQNKDSRILKILAKSIGDLKFKNGFVILQDIYNFSEEKEIKIRALESMEKFNVENKKDFLLDIIEKERDRDIRTKIIFALSTMISDKKVLSVFMKVAEDKEEWWMTRKVTIMILGSLHKKNVYNKFIEIIRSDEDSRVVRTIIQELGDSEQRESIPEIERYLESDEVDLKKVAILALSKLGEHKILEKLLNDESLRDKLMPESLKAIMNFDEEKIIELIVEILGQKKDSLLEVLFEGLAKYKNEKIKNRLIEILLNGKIKRELRVKALILLNGYPVDKSIVDALGYILDRASEWWMLKKMVIIVASDANIFQLLSKIIKYSEDLDKRISKSAREGSKKIYESYFIKKLEEEGSSVSTIAKEFLKIM